MADNPFSCFKANKEFGKVWLEKFRKKNPLIKAIWDEAENERKEKEQHGTSEQPNTVPTNKTPPNR